MSERNCSACRVGGQGRSAGAERGLPGDVQSMLPHKFRQSAFGACLPFPGKFASQIQDMLNRAVLPSRPFTQKERHLYSVEGRVAVSEYSGEAERHSGIKVNAIPG